MAQVKATIIDDRIVVESEFQHESQLKKILGAKWDKVREQWTYPLTWAACVALNLEFGADFLTSEKLNQWGVDTLNNRVGPALALRQRLDLDGIVEKPGERSTELTVLARDIGAATGLYPHQQAGAAFIAVTDARCLILDEQGTGKSKQLLVGTRVLQRSGTDMFPMLIVAPASVKTHWEREIAATYPGLTTVKISGTAAQRRKQLATPAHIYIINYNLVPKYSKLAHSPGAPALKKCKDCGGFDEKITEDKCQYHERELNKIPFKTVVVDEAHRLLSPLSTWTRSVWSISDKAEHRVAMTGTPVQDTIADYWALLRYVSPQEFSQKTKYLDRFAIVSYNPWGKAEIEGMNPLTSEELHRISQPYMRRMLKSVVLPFLPPVVKETRTVEMTGAQAKAYRDMKKKMVAELEGSTKALITLKPLTQAARLTQLASSYAEVIAPTQEELDANSDATDSVRLTLPSNKITAFLGDLEAGDYDGTAGVVVFAQSKQLLDLLAIELDKKSIEYGKVMGGQTDAERDADIDAFQAGRTRFILVSISAGGAGITLTAADTMVFLQRSWSSTGMSQALARAHRIGSEVHESIRVVDYVSENTLEFDQIDALADKAGRIDEILKDSTVFYKWLTGQSTTEEDTAA